MFLNGDLVVSRKCLSDSLVKNFKTIILLLQSIKKKNVTNLGTVLKNFNFTIEDNNF